MQRPFRIYDPQQAPADDSVQAYAKLSGDTWSYYLQDLAVTIGRTSDSQEDPVDIDLGRSKTISRKHASISFNFTSRKWEIIVLGRNGLKVNNVFVKPPKPAVQLESGSVIDVGGIQFVFTLPPSQEEEELEEEESEKDEKIDLLSHIKPEKPQKTPRERKKGIPTKKEPIPPGLEKPPYSYAVLIAEGINSTPDKRMTLSEIYQYIAQNYEYYQYANNGWQNSVRHNLSLNKAFIKVPKGTEDNRKGMYWTIDPEFEHLVTESKRKASKAKLEDHSTTGETSNYKRAFDDLTGEIVKRMKTMGTNDPMAAAAALYNEGYISSSLSNLVFPSGNASKGTKTTAQKQKPTMKTDNPLGIPTPADILASMPPQFFELKNMDAMPTMPPPAPFPMPPRPPAPTSNNPAPHPPMVPANIPPEMSQEYWKHFFQFLQQHTPHMARPDAKRPDGAPMPAFPPFPGYPNMRPMFPPFLRMAPMVGPPGKKDK